ADAARRSVGPGQAARPRNTRVVVVRDTAADRIERPRFAVRVEPVESAAEHPDAARSRRAGRTGARAVAAALDTGRQPRGAAAGGDEVQDAADRTAAVEGALRSAYDFVPVDVGRGRMCRVEAAAQRVLRHAVDQHERVVRFAAAWK